MTTPSITIEELERKTEREIKELINSLLNPPSRGATIMEIGLAQLCLNELRTRQQERLTRQIRGYTLVMTALTVLIAAMTGAMLFIAFAWKN